MKVAYTFFVLHVFKRSFQHQTQLKAEWKRHFSTLSISPLDFTSRAPSCHITCITQTTEGNLTLFPVHRFHHLKRHSSTLSLFSRHTKSKQKRDFLKSNHSAACFIWNLQSKIVSEKWNQAESKRWSKERWWKDKNDRVLMIVKANVQNGRSNG